MSTEPDGEIAWETVLVEDGVDSDLDVQLRIFYVGGGVVTLTRSGEGGWEQITVTGEMLRRIVAEVDRVQGAPTEPTPSQLAMARHPIGPDVKPGDHVRVLSQAGGRLDAIGWRGEVMPPGYSLASLSEKNEPAMRVIAVQLGDGSVVDVTRWELYAR